MPRKRPGSPTASMTSVILDASALLAALLGEPGAEVVIARRSGAMMSAVNYSEVLARTAALCGSLEDAKRRVDRQEVAVIPLDQSMATVAASLRAATKALGLSLADRCCLALALTRGLPILTADRAWQQIEVGVTVELIR
jgi:ribonuclease VapC